MARTKEGCEREKILREIKICFGITQENINSVVESLIADLYWQIIKLRECRNMIDGSNLVVEFKQGKQEMLIQTPLLKTYNDLIKNQSLTIKSLQSLTGKTSSSDDKEVKELMGFLSKKKKVVRSEDI